MNRTNNTNKLAVNALLLAIGALLHYITPAIILPMKADMTLIMLFIIMIINKKDYKTSLIAGIITGIFSSMTTTFPGGQLPNLLDKIITVNLVFLVITLIYKLKAVNKLSDNKQSLLLAAIILPIGTIVSGTVFLYSALIIVGLPAPFMILFTTVVLPTSIINLVAGIFLYNVVTLALRRRVVA